MKKRLTTFMLIYLSIQTTFAQSENNYHYGSFQTTDNVTVSIEQQLAKLFSKLNFSDVKTGLLEERGFSPLDPGYFAGEGKVYQSLSTKSLEAWKGDYRMKYQSAQKEANRIAGLGDNLIRMDNLMMQYFLPMLGKSNPAPSSMLDMEANTNAYRKLDSTLTILSSKHTLCFNPVKRYLSAISSLLKSYIQSYSPQELAALHKNENAANIQVLRVLYSGMYNGSVDTLHRPMLSLFDYDKKIQAATGNPISISIQHLHYYTLLETALTENLLTNVNGVLYDVPNRRKNPYVLNNLVAASPVSDTIESAAQFVIRPNLFISNTGKNLQAVEIDFADGKGYRRMQMNEVVSVQYMNGGDKEIKYILVYSDGTLATCHSGVYVKQRMASAIAFYSGPDAEWNVTASKAYLGIKASAKVSISYGCGNNRLRKPLIVVEGFDPLNNINYSFFTNQLRQSTSPNSLSTELSNVGYDIVYVDFANGTDYIQRNAYLLEEIINRVNQVKEGNEPVDIIGISMGGLIARYALRDMERTGQQHQADRFISFDTPHLGANVPLGFQCFFKDIALDPRFFFISKIQQGLAILNSPAARQMLIYQTPDFQPNNQSEHIKFMNELTAMGNGGFPALTRNVAISNGSQSGNGQFFAPGSQLLGITGNSLTTLRTPLYKIFGAFASIVLQTRYYVDIHVYAMPSYNVKSFVIYRAKMIVQVLGIVLYVKDASQQVSSVDPIDSAPGGKYDLTFLFGAIKEASDFVKISMVSEFSFVNTTSALNIVPPNNNLYYNVNNNNVVSNGRTNFMRIAGPVGSANPSDPKSYNQEHAVFDPTNNILLQAELTDKTKHGVMDTYISLLVNKSYNFGAGTINRLGNIQVSETGVLSINANTNTDLLPSSNPKPIQGSRFSVSVNGADNCGYHAKVLVSNGGQLILGDPVANNIGILEVRDQAAVEIRSTGILTINTNSEIHVKAGATLVVHSGATLNLNGKLTIDPGAYFCIENGAIINTGNKSILSVSPFYNPGANPLNRIVTVNCQQPFSCPGNPYALNNDALQFDGIDDYVEIPETNGTLNLGQGDFTIEAVVKSDYIGSAPDIQMILSKRNSLTTNGTVDGFMWGIWPSGQVYAQLNDVPNMGYNMGPNVLDGNCHALALVRQGNQLRFYVDGMITYSTAVGSRNINSTGSLRIGHNHISKVPFKGLIGDARIWNMAVTPSADPVNPNAFGLVGYWDMNGPSSHFVTDRSGHGNNGILGSTTGCDINDPVWVSGNSLACSVGANFRIAQQGPSAGYMITTSSGISNAVNIYPNPFSEKLSVDIAGIDGVISIKIINENGSLVYSKENCSVAETLYLGESFPAGFYFMEISSQSFQQNVKLVKIH